MYGFIPLDDNYIGADAIEPYYTGYTTGVTVQEKAPDAWILLLGIAALLLILSGNEKSA